MWLEEDYPAPPILAFGSAGKLWVGRAQIFPMRSRTRTPSESAIIFKVRRVMLCLAGFQPIEMNAIQPGHVRQFVLSDSLPLANQTDSRSDDFLDVLQLIRLWAYAALKHPA